jgi:hypothetical protein
MSSLLKKSGAACGPSVTAIRHARASSGRSLGGTAAGGSGGAGPVLSTSPARSARPPWPPKRPRVKVDALPR